jgi:alpha-L-fucosidase
MSVPRKLPILAAVVALVAALFLIPHAPARAEVLNPRQEWLRANTSGLFLHCSQMRQGAYRPR